jgi:hypothetical protein
VCCNERVMVDPQLVATLTIDPPHSHPARRAYNNRTCPSRQPTIRSSARFAAAKVAY